MKIGRWVVASGASMASLLALFAGCDPDSSLSNELTPPPAEAPPWPQDAGGGGAAAGSNYDYASFESVIQPILDTADSKGCTAGACHGKPGGQSGFALARQPAAGSPQLASNFAAVTARCDANLPGASVFYKRATTRHAGGASALVSQAQASQILAWIARAAPATPPPASPPPDGDVGDVGAGGNGGGGGADGGAPSPGGAGCIAPENFNAGLFTSKILPLLLGEVDYNVAPNQPVSANGCGRSTCHGTDRGPKALFLSSSNTPLANLKSLGCFVNAASPSASALLACPLNSPSCPKSPHPGQNVFRDPTDRNYQRLLSFLYGTKTVANPLDFAFFARQISPLFKDPAFGGLGATGQRTCANTSSCHGVNVAGATPANLSNMAMLTSTASKSQLLVDYWVASNFANFSVPTGSELFLFPTDLTADVTLPFANGLRHPGGINFGDSSEAAAASPQAQAVLQWAGGLRPDENGNLRNWLVAGTYSATQVTQPTLVGNETRLAPQIFDNSGALQFNNGQWDALISNRADVDLNTVFPGSPGSGRVAYAVAYAINTTSADLQNVLVNVTSPNVVLVYADGRPIAQSAGDGATATGIATFPAFVPGKASTRLVLKVFQRATDVRFGFSVSLINQQNNLPLSNTSGELVFRLDPSGGI